MNHSRKRATRAAVIAGALAATLVLAACSSSGGGSSSGSGAVPTSGALTMLVNITPVLTKEYYQSLVGLYTKTHPGVKVTIESPSADNVQDTIQQDLASGNLPDIVASNLTTATAKQLAPFPKSEKWVMDTPLAAQDELDGKVWQVATGTQIQSLVFYNKTAFQKAGITSPPKTLSQYTADLKLLSNAGYVGFDTSGDWVTGAQFDMLAQPDQLGPTPDWFVQKTANKVSFSNSAYEKYMTAYESWISNGSLPKNELGQKYQDTIDSFTSGKSATYVMGNWIVPSIDGVKKSFDVGVFPSPTISGDAPKQLSGPAQPYSILKASKNQALATDLIKFLVSDPAAVKKSLKSEGNFRKGYSYPGTPLNDAVGKILDQAPGAVPGNASAPGAPATFDTQLGTTVQTLFTGATAKAAAESLNTWWTANASN